MPTTISTPATTTWEDARDLRELRGSKRRWKQPMLSVGSLGTTTRNQPQHAWGAESLGGLLFAH
jgi:hypothetical protein